MRPSASSSRTRRAGIAGIAAFALLVSACGGSDAAEEEPETTEAEAEAEAEAEPETTEAEAEAEEAEGDEAAAPEGDSDATIPAVECAEPGTVRVGVWDEALAPIVEQAANQWVADYCPGAVAEIEVTPWSAYWEAMQIAAGGGGDLPDVLWMSPVLMPFYQEVGVVRNLQPLLEAGGVDTSVWGSLTDSYTFDGDIYGAPINWDTVVIAANVDLLTEAGVEVPGDDWTWDDYAAIGEQVSALGDDIFGVAGHNGYQSGYGGFMASAGVDPVLSADRTKCTLGEPGSIETMQFFVDLVNSGVAPSPDDANGGNYTSLFVDGRLGMTTLGSWDFKQTVDAVDFEMVLLPMPANPTTGNSEAIANAIAYTITTKTEIPELAANLVQYLSSDEGSQFWIDGGGFAPANPSPALQEGWLAQFADGPVDATEYAKALDGAQAITVFGLDMWNAVNGELETRLFTNGESPAEVADAICKIVDAGIS